MDLFTKTELVEKVIVRKRTTRSRVTCFYETTVSTETTSLNRDLDAHGELLQQTEENEEPDSETWDVLWEIALEQAERAASRWGSSSLGKTVQTFSKADSALAYVVEEKRFRCQVILAYELPKPLSGFEYDVMERDDFLIRYNDMSQEDRIFYELIDHKRQCHLYFDLEFSTDLNNNKNGDEMVDTLLMITTTLIASEFPHVRHESPWILETDSSREHKFSRHLLIIVPQLLFCNNQELLPFVSKVCQYIEVNKAKFQAYNELFVETKKGTRLFVDLSVYKRKQLMRLPFSTKCGLSSFLTPTCRFGTTNFTTEDLNDMMKIFITAYDESTSNEVCRQIQDKGESSGLKTQATIEEVFNSHSENSMPLKTTTSPFPALDEFVLKLANEHPLAGEIFMFIVNCQARTCHTKCHDFSYRGYVSDKVNIPDECFEIFPEGIPPSASIENC